MVSDLFSVFEEKYFKGNKIESLLHMITTILFVLWSPTSVFLNNISCSISITAIAVALHTAKKFFNFDKNVIYKSTGLKWFKYKM